jgi:hypothetical protein
VKAQTDGEEKSWPGSEGGNTMSLIIYLIGFAFVIGGIAWALIVAKVGTVYVMIAVVILIGIAILTGVTRTRTKD